MTKKTTNSRLNFRFVSIIVLSLLLIVSVFGFIACDNSDSSTDDEKTFTYIEKDEQIIKNGNFEYGTQDTELKDFSVIAPNDWSVLVDNSAVSSLITSGIINTSETSYKKLLSVLYEDADFITYIKSQLNFPYQAISEAKETAEAIKEETINVLMNGSEDYGGVPAYFANPGVHEDAEGTKILMLNNYNTNSSGTAMCAESSSTVTIKKGTHGLITFRVKTINLQNGTGKNGANVRLVNSFGSITQEDYGIYNIITDGEWKKFTLYVKGDSNSDVNVQVVLGLGFGGGNATISRDYVQGTVFFDDVKFEEIEEKDLPAVANITVFDYTLTTSEKRVLLPFDGDWETPYLYSMSLNESIESAIGLFDNVTFINDEDHCYFTKSHTEIGSGPVTSVGILGDKSSVESVALYEDGSKITVSGIKNAAYSIKLTSDLFSVDREGYAFITFKMNVDLGRFDTKGVSVYVYDVSGSPNIVSSPVKFSTKDGVLTGRILVKNNFPKTSETQYTKDFYLVFAIGPTSFASTYKEVDFSSGEVSIFDVKVAKGYTYQYERDYSVDPYTYDSSVETENYDYYTIFSGIADSTISLYAGYETDYSEETDESDYSLHPAGSEVNGIENAPTAVSYYSGVVSNHIYVTESETATAEVNTRTGEGDADGNVAGLINTKYIDNYTMADEINAALDYKGSTPIQPIMIYNNTANAYGFIGQRSTISATSFASITVRVRVVGDAKANVYIIDATRSNKEIATISFTPNADKYGNDQSGLGMMNAKLSFENITADMMEADGWLKLTFYIATGNNAHDFRVELWNGSRDGSAEGASEGFVFFDSVLVTTSAAFEEPENYASINILKQLITEGKLADATAYYYKRQLDSVEIEYNKTHTDSPVVYYAKPIYVFNDKIQYVIYNSIDPLPVDPYESEEEEPTQSCVSESNPSQFWLSFSSILLGAVLILAIIALFIKNLRRRHKANRNDAKSHYSVKSRYNKKAKKDLKDIEEEVSEESESTEETTEEIPEEPTEEVTEEENKEAETLEEFVYGDVQDFGELTTNEDKPEEDVKEPEENKGE